MASLRCEHCRHYNPANAESCEECEAPLHPGPQGGPGWRTAATAGPGRAWSPADDIPAPPFKQAGDVLLPMLAVYRKQFTLVGLLVLLTTVPQVLLQYGVLDVLNGAAAGVHEGGDSRGIAGMVNLFVWLMGIFCRALLSGALIYAVVDLQRTGHASAVECLRRGLKVLPQVFVVSLLYWVIVAAGWVLFFVPGVIFSLMFAVSVPAAVIERRRVLDAMMRSYELTKGSKGQIFVTYFLWLLLVIVVALVLLLSFVWSETMESLPMALLWTVVFGMINSSLHVLTAYIYLGLVREHRSGLSPVTV